MPSNGIRILIVDDDSQIRRLLKIALEAHDYIISEVVSAESSLTQAVVFRPDLILLDLGLPDFDGFEVIQRLREWSKTPIIILTVRADATAKISALDYGADDYITKPFHTEELLARIRSTLRRAVKTEDQPFIQIDDLTIDFSHHLVKIRDKTIRLAPIEYAILKQLALSSGRVVTHRQLLQTIWGNQYQKEIHYIREYVRRIRQKIESDPTRPKYILTESGIGYRFATKP